MTVVRKDADGLYVRAGGYIARPGPVTGYECAYDMSADGVRAGDTVKAAHMPGTPLTRLRLADGSVRVWHHY